MQEMQLYSACCCSVWGNWIHYPAICQYIPQSTGTLLEEGSWQLLPLQRLNKSLDCLTFVCGYRSNYVGYQLKIPPHCSIGYLHGKSCKGKGLGQFHYSHFELKFQFQKVDQHASAIPPTPSSQCCWQCIRHTIEWDWEEWRFIIWMMQHLPSYQRVVGPDEQNRSVSNGATSSYGDVTCYIIAILLHLCWAGPSPFLCCILFCCWRCHYRARDAGVFWSLCCPVSWQIGPMGTVELAFV